MDELQWTKRNTLLYKKYISLSFYFRKGYQFAVSLSDRWRDIWLERRLLAQYLLPGARGATACIPLEAVSSETTRTPLIGSDRLEFRFSWLTVWFSYHVVFFRLHTCSTGQPRRTATPLFSNHNMTAWQSTRVTRNERKIHVDSHYITFTTTRQTFPVLHKPIVIVKYIKSLLIYPLNSSHT